MWHQFTLHALTYCSCARMQHWYWTPFMLQELRQCYGGKTYVTCDSHVVPHRSTEQAQRCLTSEFGWDPVYPRWYDRMMNREEILGLHTQLEFLMGSRNPNPTKTLHSKSSIKNFLFPDSRPNPGHKRKKTTQWEQHYYTQCERKITYNPVETCTWPKVQKRILNLQISPTVSPHKANPKHELKRKPKPNKTEQQQQTVKYNMKTNTLTGGKSRKLGLNLSRSSQSRRLYSLQYPL